MHKSKMVGFLFVLLGLLLVIGASYVVITYATDVLSGIVDFVTMNDLSKLKQCGIEPPAQFSKLKVDFTTVILPSLYLGVPVLLLALSALMFLGGFYYHKGKHDDDRKLVEQMEREMVHKLVSKMESKKGTKSSVSQAATELHEEVGEQEEGR